MVMVNTDFGYFSYTPLPDVILPEEGNPYYYYYDNSDSGSGYYNDGDDGDGQKEKSEANETKSDNGAKRRSIRSVDDLKRLTQTQSTTYWPDYYYSIEAIAVL